MMIVSVIISVIDRFSRDDDDRCKLSIWNHSIIQFWSCPLYTCLTGSNFTHALLENYYRRYNFEIEIIYQSSTLVVFEMLVIQYCYNCLFFIFEFLKLKDYLTWNRNLFIRKSNPVENRIQVQRNLSCGRDAKNETMKS